MRKFIFVCLGLICLAAGWYLFIKQYDYQFRFKAKYGPASVYKEILEWEKFDEADSLFSIRVTNKRPFLSISQKINLKNNDHLKLEWELEYVNDSVTSVVVNTLDDNHKIKNRLQILNPFQKSPYVETLQTKITALLKDLVKRQQSYTITLKDTAVSPGFYCAYITAKATAEGKPKAMTMYVGELEDYLADNHLKLKGFPIVKVTNWDIETDSIYFDFCFPIEYREGLPEYGDVKLKKVLSVKSLKAVFHGNYGLSYLAWYDLYDKAKRKEIPIKNKPLEVFHNNPMMGGNDSEWQADVYMPLEIK